MGFDDVYRGNKSAGDGYLAELLKSPAFRASSSIQKRPSKRTLRDPKLEI